MASWSERNKKKWKCKRCDIVPRLVQLNLGAGEYHCRDCGEQIAQNWLKKGLERMRRKGIDV